MSVTEAQRLHLFKTFERVLGAEDAATMMAMLAPVGWADVATKRDLDFFRAATKQDLDALRAATKLDVGALEGRMATKDDIAELRREMHEQTTRFIGWMLGSNTALAGIFGALVAFT